MTRNIFASERNRKVDITIELLIETIKASVGNYIEAYGSLMAERSSYPFYLLHTDQIKLLNVRSLIRFVHITGS